MRKINDTMNRLAVAAYVEGGRMRKKLADVLTIGNCETSSQS